MKDFRDLKVGDKLVCVNEEGWEEKFEKGGVYVVTRICDIIPGFIELDGTTVSPRHSEDFEPYKPSSSSTKKNDIRAWVVVVAETGQLLSLSETRDNARECKRILEKSQAFGGKKLRIAKLTFDSFVR